MPAAPGGLENAAAAPACTLQVLWLNHGKGPSAASLPFVGRGVRMHAENSVTVSYLYRRSFALKVRARRWLATGCPSGEQRCTSPPQFPLALSSSRRGAPACPAADGRECDASHALPPTGCRPPPPLVPRQVLRDADIGDKDIDNLVRPGGAWRCLQAFVQGMRRAGGHRRRR